ncbi:MAG TPA: hypothetical protein VK436_10800 [Methanocella sp.]|nr:hypothetical protein [Methanocella sp.]
MKLMSPVRIVLVAIMLASLIGAVLVVLIGSQYSRESYLSPSRGDAFANLMIGVEGQSQSQAETMLPSHGCSSGYYYDPVVRQCVPGSPVPTDGPRVCPYGYHVDPVTLRCTPDIPGVPWTLRPLSVHLKV